MRGGIAGLRRAGRGAVDALLPAMAVGVLFAVPWRVLAAVLPAPFAAPLAGVVAAGALAAAWRWRLAVAARLAALAGAAERVPPAVWWAVLLGLGLGLRLVAVALLSRPFASDGREYFELARGLVERGAYLSASGGLAEWPPGYPFFLAVVMLLAGTGPAVVPLSNLVLFVALAVLVGTTGGLLLGRGAGRMAALVVAVWPNLVLLAPVPAKELLAAVLVLAALRLHLAAAAGAHGGRPGLEAAAGALLGMAALVQPATLLLVVPLVLWRWLWSGGRRLLPASAALLAGALLVLAPWTVRNHLRFGEPVLISTNGGSVFYRANNPLATGGHTPRGAVDLRPLGELEESRTGYRLGLAWIGAHPGGFARLALAKQALFLGESSDGPYETMRRGRPRVSGPYVTAKLASNGFWWALWALLLSSALAGRGGRRDGRQDLLALALLTLLAVHSVFESGARHHVPLAGPIALLAVAGVRVGRGEAVRDAGGASPARYGARSGGDEAVAAFRPPGIRS